MDLILYAAQLAAGLGLIAVAGIALLAVIEGVWWLFCKATGREY